MASIFDKYKPTSTKKIKDLSADEDSKTNSGGFAGRLDLEDGTNKIRIYPAHPGEESFIRIRACHWITIEVEGQREPQRRTVPNARIHLGIETDPIEAYMDFCREQFSGSEQAANSAKLKKILSNSFNGGLLMATTWTVYASSVNKDGKKSKPLLFEMKRTVREALKNEMIIEDESEAIESDPFTDPRTGKPVIITYNSKAKKSSDYYKIQIGKNSSPLTKEELEAFDKMTPLSRLPEMNYSLADFELALEGIKYYDESEEINLFEEEEFQERLKEIKKQVKDLVGGVSDADDNLPFDEDENKSKKKVGKKKKDEEEEQVDEPDEPVEDEPEEPTGDKFDEMERPELIKYKAEQGYADLKMFKGDSDDDLREKLRAYEAEHGEPEDPEEAVEEPAEEEDIPAPAKKSDAKKGSKITLEEIKAKINANKNKKK